jgi:hypothetical protein
MKPGRWLATRTVREREGLGDTVGGTHGSIKRLARRPKAFLRSRRTCRASRPVRVIDALKLPFRFRSEHLPDRYRRSPRWRRACPASGPTWRLWARCTSKETQLKMISGRAHRSRYRTAMLGRTRSAATPAGTEQSRRWQRLLHTQEVAGSKPAPGSLQPDSGEMCQCAGPGDAGQFGSRTSMTLLAGVQLPCRRRHQPRRGDPPSVNRPHSMSCSPPPASEADESTRSNRSDVRILPPRSPDPAALFLRERAVAGIHSLLRVS